MTPHRAPTLRPLIATLLASGLFAAPIAALADTTVTVTVEGDHIVLSPDPLLVGNAHNVTLTWTIATAGWTFAHDGVQVESDDGEFGPPVLSADHRSLHETDKDDNAKAYKYEVTLTNGHREITIDPTIQNGGHG